MKNIQQPAYLSQGALKLSADHLELIGALIVARYDIELKGKKTVQILSQKVTNTSGSKVTKEKGQTSTVTGTREDFGLPQVKCEKGPVAVLTEDQGDILVEAIQGSGTALYMGADPRLEGAEAKEIRVKAGVSHNKNVSQTDHAVYGDTIRTTDYTQIFPSTFNQIEGPDPTLALLKLEEEVTQEIAHQRHYLANHSLYPAQGLAGEEEGMFRVKDVLGDGNCALHCLGISRAEAVRLLLEHGRDRVEIRRRVMPDICAYIRDQNQNYIRQFPHLQDRYQRLIEQEETQRLKRSRLQGDINDLLGHRLQDRATETAVLLTQELPVSEGEEKRVALEQKKAELQIAEAAFLEAEGALNDLLIDPELYCSYITMAYGTPQGWFSYSPNPGATMALDALCEIKGINLTIKQMTQGGKLKTMHTHHTCEGGVEKILWHTTGGQTKYLPYENLNHFSLLIPHDIESEDQIRQRVMSQRGAASVLLPFSGATFRAQKVVKENFETNASVTITAKTLLEQIIKPESHTKVKRSGLAKPALQATLNLAIAIGTAWSGLPMAMATNGLGLAGAQAYAVSGMISAGITRTGMSAINSGFNPMAVLKDVTSKAALKSYVIEGLAALTIHGISTEFSIPMTSVADSTKKAVEMSTLTTFSEHLQAQLLRNVVRTPLNIAIGGQDAGDALKNAIRSVAANTVGGFSANIIGAEYREGITDTVTHQVLHAMNGAVIGGILGGKDGLLPGMIGSTMAELMPKLMGLNLPDIERRLKAGEDLKVLQDEISKAADMGRLGGAVINTMLQEDVDIGIQAGTIAAENNLIPAVVWMAAKITWEMYALMFPEDIERAKGMLCNYIAEHTGLPVEKVNLLADIVINGSSLVKAVRGRVKKVLEHGVKKTVQYGGPQRALPKPDAKPEKSIKAANDNQAPNSEPSIKKTEVDLPKKDLKKLNSASDQIPTHLPLDYWNRTIQYKGNKVYQRNDLIDPNFISSDGLNLTNLQRMKLGKAPYSLDSKKIELHHMLQTQQGPIAEVTSKFHKENFSIIHINPNTILSGIDRPKFDSWRVSYWKMRANDFVEKKFK